MPQKKTAIQAQYEEARVAQAEAEARCETAREAAHGGGLAATILALEAQIACHDAERAMHPIAVRFADELIVAEAAAGDPDALLANPQNVVDDLTQALADVESARLAWEEKKAAVLTRREAAEAAALRLDAKREAAGLPATNWPINGVSDPRVGTTAVIEAFNATIKHGSKTSRDCLNQISRSRMEVRERLTNLSLRYDREQKEAKARAEAAAEREAQKEAQRRAQEAEAAAWRKKCDDERAAQARLIDSARNAE